MGEFDAIPLIGRIHFSRHAKPVGHAFSVVIVAITLRVMKRRRSAAAKRAAE